MVCFFHWLSGEFPWGSLAKPSWARLGAFFGSTRTPTRPARRASGVLVWGAGLPWALRYLCLDESRVWNIIGTYVFRSFPVWWDIVASGASDCGGDSMGWLRVTAGLEKRGGCAGAGLGSEKPDGLWRRRDLVCAHFAGHILPGGGARVEITSVEKN